jgi:hypothetical protein
MVDNNIESSNLRDRLLKLRLENISVNARPRREANRVFKPSIKKQEIDAFRIKLLKERKEGGLDKVYELPDTSLKDNFLKEAQPEDLQKVLTESELTKLEKDLDRDLREADALYRQIQQINQRTNVDEFYNEVKEMKTDLDEVNLMIKNNPSNKPLSYFAGFVDRIDRRLGELFTNYPSLNYDINGSVNAFINDIDTSLKFVKNYLRSAPDVSNLEESYELINKNIMEKRQILQENNRNIEINQSELDRIDRLNKDNIRLYETTFNTLNTANVQRKEGETDEDYVKRMEEIGNTTYNDEQIALYTELDTLDILKRNLKELMSDESLILNVIKSLKEDDRFKINRDFELIKNKFLIRYGYDNKLLDTSNIINFLLGGYEKEYNDGLSSNYKLFNELYRRNLRTEQPETDGQTYNIRWKRPNYRTEQPQKTTYSDPYVNEKKLLDELSSNYKKFKLVKDKEKELITDDFLLDDISSDEFIKYKKGETVRKGKYIINNMKTKNYNCLGIAYKGKQTIKTLYLALGIFDNTKNIFFTNSKPSSRGNWNLIGYSNIYNLKNVLSMVNINDNDTIKELFGKSLLYSNSEDNYNMFFNYLNSPFGCDLEIYKPVSYGSDEYELNLMEFKTPIGLGITNKYNIPKEPAKYGKILINLDKLYYKNILSIKDINNKPVQSFKNTPVSDDFVNYVLKIFFNEQIDESDYKKIKSNELQLLDELNYIAGFGKEKNINKIDNIKKLKDQLELITGSVMAGNNNEKLLDELRSVLMKLVSFDAISLESAKKYIKQFKVQNKE